MAIPDYQTVMLPLLEHLGDKEEKATRETLDALTSKFNLTEEGKEKQKICLLQKLCLPKNIKDEYNQNYSQSI